MVKVEFPSPLVEFYSHQFYFHVTLNNFLSQAFDQSYVSRNLRKIWLESIFALNKYILIRDPPASGILNVIFHYGKTFYYLQTHTIVSYYDTVRRRVGKNVYWFCCVNLLSFEIWVVELQTKACEDFTIREAPKTASLLLLLENAY